MKPHTLWASQPSLLHTSAPSDDGFTTSPQRHPLSASVSACRRALFRFQLPKAFRFSSMSSRSDSTVSGMDMYSGPLSFYCGSSLCIDCTSVSATVISLIKLTLSLKISNLIISVNIASAASESHGMPSEFSISITAPLSTAVSFRLVFPSGNSANHYHIILPRH